MFSCSGRWGYSKIFSSTHRRGREGKEGEGRERGIKKRREVGRETKAKTWGRGLWGKNRRDTPRLPLVAKQEVARQTLPSCPHIHRSHGCCTGVWEVMQTMPGIGAKNQTLWRWTLRSPPVDPQLPPASLSVHHSKGQWGGGASASISGHITAAGDRG